MVVMIMEKEEGGMTMTEYEEVLINVVINMIN